MGKVLVAYFSASGVTAKLAARLADAVGADLHEIRPAVPYTSADLDWMDKKSRNRKAEEMLDLVGLTKHKKHRPNQMSGGQQQRVGVARALVVEPEIIFADEPTGNLDSNTSVEVMNLMKRVVREKNQTLVMVTHDNYLAGFADIVIRIRDGKILEISERDGQDMPEEIAAQESCKKV